MASKSKHVVLSIDFDFFIKEDISYDWGHRENGLFIGPIWPIRAMQLLSQGIDPLKDVGLVEDPSELPVSLKKLGWKFCKQSRLSIAESHASAYHALKYHTNLEIINIDAHHDICYGQDEKLDCGNWIYMLAKEGRVKKVTIVYPLWRKSEHDAEMDSDYLSNESVKKLTSLGVEVDVVYGIDKTHPRKVREVFIARSGAWVPPWTDDEFLQFISVWSLRTRIQTIWNYQSLDQFKREFDLEEVKKGAELMKVQMGEMSSKRLVNKIIKT